MIFTNPLDHSICIYCDWCAFCEEFDLDDDIVDIVQQLKLSGWKFFESINTTKHICPNCM